MDEKITGIIPGLRKAAFFGGGDAFTLVVTDRRLIFARLTAQMVKEAGAEAQRRGKADGRGFFSRWGEQIRAASQVHEKYFAMPVEAILAENPGNFALENAVVGGVRIRKKTRDVGADRSDFKTVTKFKFETPAGERAFDADGFDQRWIEVLTATLGNRVTAKTGIFG